MIISENISWCFFIIFLSQHTTDQKEEGIKGVIKSNKSNYAASVSTNDALINFDKHLMRKGENLENKNLEKRDRS